MSINVVDYGKFAFEGDNLYSRKITEENGGQDETIFMPQMEGLLGPNEGATYIEYAICYFLLKKYCGKFVIIH